MSGDVTALGSMGDMSKPELTILLANPRGFCAGVERAINIVEAVRDRYGTPVYVRHEIVHNKHVVHELRAKGAVFVEELDDCPDDRPVVFSAHGVPKSVPAEAERRNMIYVDATCPLVSKVHMEAERHYARGLEIILIGHAGHPEVIGTMGQLPPDTVKLVETAVQARAYQPKDPGKLAYTTQTTLSIDDTREIVEILRSRFPKMVGPHKEDICYATTNRQVAVKSIAQRCDRLIVVGAPNSSNSKRLVEVAQRAGCGGAALLQCANDIDWSDYRNIRTIGITAGASAPEVLVDEIIAAFADRFETTLEAVSTADENVSFKLPRKLRGSA